MDQITFGKFTLANGLDVILHKDSSLPLVAVNVWYHVGSKDEIPGKTGYAHLFEHLMFEGSKHHNSSHFEPLQQVGATLNGSTTPDRTNYWENLPSNYLELALWLESDRMGFLLDALDQGRFDIQRDVVKNERRQSYENRPYGLSSIAMQASIYPLPHPYHWPTIGFHEDLDSATVEDARTFFQRFYTPSNASLAIAGDFELDETREMVERYFGDLPPGPALPRASRMDSPLRSRVQLTEHDRVLLPRLSLAWPTVPRFHPDEAALSVLGMLLGSGKSSRLHRKLVYRDRIAQTAGARHGGAEIAGDFDLEVTAAAGHTALEMGDAAREEIRRLQSEPPSAEEMERVKNHLEWQHVHQMASIGGFGGKANRLNSFNVFAGDPGRLNVDIERFLAVRAEDVSRVAAAYLDGPHVQMVVLPEPVRSHSTASIDRTVEPSPAAPRSFTPPLPQRDRLPNGLDLLVVEKRGLSAVAMSLILDTGAAGDPTSLPGLAAFTTAMFQEGTTTRSSSQIADAFELMGAQLVAVTGRESSVLATETLTRHWPTALELVADLVRQSTFPEEERSRLQTQRLTAMRRMRDDPTAMAGRVAPILLYGGESSYGHPISGTENALQAITRADLLAHFEANFGPARATLAVVGDVSLDEVRRVAQECLGDWSEPEQSAPVQGGLGERPVPDAATMYLFDRPGAAQSVIRVGRIGVPRSHPDYHALGLLNHLFGGQFTSRLNANLRQDKGYSYGYRSWMEWHRRSSLLMAGGSVQTDVTREAVVETLREFREIGGERPITEEEFSTAKAALLRQFPSSFETPWQVLEELNQIVSFALADDYYATLPAEIEAVSLEDVRRVARENAAEDHLTLLVVGDLSATEAGLRGLGFPVRLVDHEGLDVAHRNGGSS